MTSYTTRTAEFGQITFTAPAADDHCDGYVWIETGSKRQQICHGGDFMGNTVTARAGGDLKKAAQKWLRQRRDWMRNA